MRHDNFGESQVLGAVTAAQFFTTIRHILWAIVLVLWGIPNSVEIIRILATAFANG
jgi:hypothetical protein